MADTLPDVVLEAGIPRDLYAATTIPVGTKIRAQNNSSDDVRVYAGASSPVIGDAGSVLLRSGMSASNLDTDGGAWAWSSVKTTLSVQVAV